MNQTSKLLNPRARWGLQPVGADLPYPVKSGRSVGQDHSSQTGKHCLLAPLNFNKLRCGFSQHAEVHFCMLCGCTCMPEVISVLNYSPPFFFGAKVVPELSQASWSAAPAFLSLPLWCQDSAKSVPPCLAFCTGARHPNSGLYACGFIRDFIKPISQCHD